MDNTSSSNEELAAKHPRTEEGAPDASALPEKYKELFFDDGNIILQCQDAIFRVHRSVLSVHSEVFRDMFAVGTPQDSLAEGVAVVHMPDPAEDMYHLIKMFYFANHVRNQNTMDMRFLTGLLDISSKYMVDFVQTEIGGYLRAYFPSSLSEFQVSYESLDATLTVSDCIRAIRAGIKHNIPEILPVAYYRCSQFPPKAIFRGYTGDAPAEGETVVTLPMEALETCILGRHQLVREKRIIMDDYIRKYLDNTYERHCSQALMQQFVAYFVGENKMVNGYENDVHLFNRERVAMCMGKEELLDLICRPCQLEWIDEEDIGRGMLWRRLPSFYGLGTWAELSAHRGAGSTN
ncbi:hypothetical protein OF83DRAFT_436044 [Amylostereum chailletii]|nr:hypothetical protein OF83DRAFT_436044 [Amylostereum chailletii]